MVIAASLSLADVGGTVRLWHQRRVEFLLSVTAFLGVALLGVLAGDRRRGRTLDPERLPSRLVALPDDPRPGPRHAGHHDRQGCTPTRERLPGLVIFRFDAPLFFANARGRSATMSAAAAVRDPRPRWIVVAAEPITDVDTTAADMLADLDEELNAKGHSLVFAELKDPVRAKLERYELIGPLDPDHFFSDDRGRRRRVPRADRRRLDRGATAGVATAVKWELAIVAASVLAVAAFSSRLTSTPVTPAMAFVVIGVLLGPLVIGEVTGSPTGTDVRTLAEATLSVVLFADASRIKLSLLRHEYTVPLRLLAIGLPLTIVAGAVLAGAVFGELSTAEALVLAVLLAPTDAALGQSVVTEEGLPSRIRQGLNVESGLNDGICVPLLLIVLAAAEVEDHASSGHHAISIVAEEIGYGIVGGVAAGVCAAAVVAVGYRRGLVTGSWLQVIPVAGAALAYGIAVALGGSGFIAAFVGGAIFGAIASRESDEASRFSEEVGAVLGGVTFLVFGAILLGPALKHVTWEIVLYAVLSLTVVRMLPVAIALLGTSANWRTVAFVGWFGPRGLASIVFAVIVVQEANLPGATTILLTTYFTIGLSVLAHGLTAAPLARAYADWYASRPRHLQPRMESVDAHVHRPRGPHHVR